MTRQEFKRIHAAQYERIIGRVVRQMEKDVMNLLGDHPSLSIYTTWDIVSDAVRQADRIVTGGYKYEE